MPAGSRSDIILALVNRNSLGLEIGPSYNPIVPKSGGWNVEIVDHLSAEALREKYTAWNVDVSKIEDVDYVVTDRGLVATIGKPESFDFIVASHVIEHMPDLVGFLRDCSQLLKPGGILTLAVPDKRFCFDVFQEISSIGTVMQAAHEQRKLHTYGNVLNQYANHAMRKGQIVWFDRELEQMTLVHPLTQAKELADNYISEGKFADTHAWYFTPESFSLIIEDLSEMGMTDFTIANAHGTMGYEFFVSLQKGVKRPRKERVERLLALRNELRQV